MFLQVLYSELGNTFTIINQYLAEVTNTQNSLLHWVDAIKRGIAKLVPVHLVKTLTHQCVDANLISVITNHVLETGPMVQSLDHEVEVLDCCLATIPSVNPTCLTAWCEAEELPPEAGRHRQKDFSNGGEWIGTAKSPV
ncbi:hypothetical protein DSO57_1028033 [Entomophthora muscae]|uniref:Uncharacterized protein n=1 Tax=Entomophthora muscae TaxID=34485 RepID=A0ACC2TCS8_9FUNG|nr:hypothetical protein DSO57_1028033 [Entomophthora muscae]